MRLIAAPSLRRSRRSSWRRRRPSAATSPSTGTPSPLLRADTASSSPHPVSRPAGPTTACWPRRPARRRLSARDGRHITRVQPFGNQHPRPPRPQPPHPRRLDRANARLGRTLCGRRDLTVSDLALTEREFAPGQLCHDRSVAASEVARVYRPEKRRVRNGGGRELSGGAGRTSGAPTGIPVSIDWFCRRRSSCGHGTSVLEALLHRRLFEGRTRETEGPEPRPANRVARLRTGLSTSAAARLGVPLVRCSSAPLGPAHPQGSRGRSARLSPLPGRDADGRLHHRRPRHPPHPRPPRRLSTPRHPGPCTASRRLHRSRIPPIPRRLGADSDPAPAARSNLVFTTVREAEACLALLENRLRKPTAHPRALALGGGIAAVPPPGGLRARFGHQPDRRPNQTFVPEGGLLRLKPFVPVVRALLLVRHGPDTDLFRLDRVVDVVGETAEKALAGSFLGDDG